MYIPYNIFLNISFLKIFHKFLYNKKIEQNCNYVYKNKSSVLKKLKTKDKLNVLFYVYDETKWKCQYLYELMCKSDKFVPRIVVTRNSVTDKTNPSYQPQEDIIKCYEFFTKKNMNTVLGYDFEKNKHIPFEEFSPDIVIYQHPWYVETSQGPVICSKFALTAYVPYDISCTTSEIEYNLRFFQYVENYYVVSDILKEFYTPRMFNRGINLKTAGAPTLDYFTFNKRQNEKGYVIYAPHWTINHQKTIAYSTFADNGIFMLDYAKKHQEFNWVFKPHPMLKKAVIDNNLMSEGEISEYYASWEKIGTACYDCDYFKYFNDSQLMITDCCTFLTEYFATGKPLIRLVSDDGAEFNDLVNNLLPYFYNIKTNEELEKMLDDILVNKIDVLKEKRQNAVLNIPQNASQNILKDILQQISK